jgi:Glycosyltransferase family 87
MHQLRQSLQLIRLGDPAAIIYAVGFMILIALAAGSTVEGFRHALLSSQDFVWGPSRALLLRQDPYAISAEWMKQPGAFNPFYVATTLVFIWPVAALPWTLAKAVWAIIGILGAATIAAVLNRRYLENKPATGFFIFLALLISAPARATLDNAQVALFAVSTFLLAFDVAERHRHVAAILLAASWIKYPLTFPLTLLFLRKDRILIVIEAAVIHIGLLLFLAAWLGQNPVSLLLAPLPVMSQLKSSGFIDAFSFMPWLGLSSPAAPFVLSALLCLAALCVTLFRQQSNELLTFSTLSIVSCLWVYHRIYDLVILVVPLCLVVRRVLNHASVSNDRWVAKTEKAFFWLSVVMLATTWYLLSQTLDARLSQLAGPTVVDVIYCVAALSTYCAVLVGTTAVMLGYLSKPFTQNPSNATS